MARKNWYDRGFADALEGQREDPPMNPGHRSFEDYRAGYEDGQQQLDGEADYDRANSRPNKAYL